MANTDFRKEIQALRNQAKARGHKNIVNNEELREKAFVYSEDSKPNYTYVYKDILKTSLFVLFSCAFLFVAAVKLSSIPQFDHIRVVLKIAKFSF